MDASESPSSARTALLNAARDELAEKGHAGVSLRAVARRADLSHAAPAHFFGDRAGMLTAVAAEGFRGLSGALETASTAATAAGEPKLAALGRAYVDFGLANPALIDLMFRRSELDPADPDLVEAQRDSFAYLRGAIEELTGEQAEGWSLVTWAVVHGLVTLAREGALAPAVGRDPAEASDLARELVALYTVGLEAATS